MKCGAKVAEVAGSFLSDGARRSPWFSSALLLLVLGVASLAVPLSAQAPTLPGAPFLPTIERSEHVLERLDAITALESLRQAQNTLALRTSDAATGEPADDLNGEVAGAELEETNRILEAQINSLERTLDRLEETESVLLDETADFGLGLAIFPVDEVRKPFWNDWGRPRSGGRTHIGTDVLAQIGIPLRAIEDGEVETISSGGNGGNGIFLIGDSGARYYYAHMDDIADLAPGDSLLAGQIVGTVGDTGNARGAPHLHMQWDPNGGSNWQNPFPLLDALFGAGRTTAFAIAAAEISEAEAAAIAEAEEADVSGTNPRLDEDDLIGTDSQVGNNLANTLLTPGRSLGSADR